jgi:hypothetical protein
VRSFAAEADYAADGRLERVRRSFARDDTDDLDAGLERAASIAPERVIWDGRVSAPEPWPDDPEALVGPLAAALDRAVRDALADAPVEAPFVVEVIGGERSFVPQARIVGAAWRDLVRGRSQHDGAALSDLHEAVAHGHGVQVDLVDRLDAEALRACRAFTTAFDGTAIWTRDPYSDVVADDLGTRLSDLLNRMPVHGTADPFLALVEITGRFSDGRPGRERARWSAPQFERFMASVTSSRGRASVGTTVERALRDRDALQAYLSEGGLPEHAARLAHEVARMGFRLDGGRGRSRLGGRALLPPGEPCPVGERALTFLAGIDLGELPPSELPDQGWMLFFADLGDDDVGFCEEDDNRPGSMIRMFFTEEPVEAEPCSRDLAERRVLPTPFLMLPNGQAEREEAGLDVFESKTYAELVYALTEPTWADSPHWVGGWPTGPQGVVADSDTLLLLQIADDEELEFHYLDAGTIQFRIPPGALAERDWPRVRAIAESS